MVGSRYSPTEPVAKAANLGDLPPKPPFPFWPQAEPNNHYDADAFNEWMDMNMDCSFGLFVNDFFTCAEDHIEAEKKR